MSSTNILGLLGGLALFLYGMQMMSNGLESVAGNKMKDILEKLTSNRFLGIIVGALITAVIQSSSATTVMVVGFVNSGMMTLNQAVWIIMGANIGTTITGQLIALDVGALAPLIAFIGVALVVFSKNEKVQFVGEIIAGLGILFVGMNMMGDSMVPLREYPPFINLMTRFSNPLIGIIAGMIFTAVIQSSSASVGILQALALSGVISFHDAAFVLFGQNIGTCITAILASIGTERSAKRATIIHLSFNIIGTAIFTILCLVTPLTNYVAGFSGSSITKQIANMHTLFNISTTILLIPFGNYLAKLATKILPEKAEEKEQHKHLKYIKSVDTRVDATFGTSAINLQNLRNEIQRMLEMARVNVEESFDAFLAGSSRFLGDVDKREDYIDYLNKEISRAAAKMMAHETNVKASKNIGSYLDMTSNFWKICEIAAEVSLPLQCHTGMGQVIDTNILQLNNVIKNNPETKFVLLHCGFPWVDDLFSIVDGYPNLYPDLTWLPILSYTASKRVMHQLIEMSQIDKICWGCDTWTVEESYGSLLAFRFSLCSVLREKIEDGYLSVNNAKDIIDKILFDNAGKIYV